MAAMKMGVSAAKLVATIEVPATYHGRERPATKNSATPWLAFFANAKPIRKAAAT